MVWYLLLAHFLSDFLFQTDWMVRNRDKLWVLSLHAMTHFVWMFFLVGQSRSTIWPFLLVITFLHFIQDKIKIYLTNKRPDWTQLAFIIDQILHYTTIVVISWWYRAAVGSFSGPEKPFWVILAISFLVVTYVWFISERIFNLSNSEYVQDINNTKFSRMLARAALLGLFVLLRSWSMPVLAMALPNPYPQSKFRQRALLTDISVSLLAVVFLFGVLR